MTQNARHGYEMRYRHDLIVDSDHVRRLYFEIKTSAMNAETRGENPAPELARWLHQLEEIHEQMQRRAGVTGILDINGRLVSK